MKRAQHIWHRLGGKKHRRAASDQPVILSEEELLRRERILACDKVRALNAVVFATPTQQHYINEMLTRAIAERVIQRGDVVLDLGANAGFHLFAFADLVGPDGLVHAFEPNPFHWPRLVGENIRLWPFAAGHTISVEQFYFPQFHDGAASLHDIRELLPDTRSVKELTVVQVPIDSLGEIAGRQVRFVKIDVERHELQALQGMEALIANCKPVIILESASDPIRQFLARHSYRPIQMTYSVWGSHDTLLPNTLFAPDGCATTDCTPSDERVLDIIQASHAFR